MSQPHPAQDSAPQCKSAVRVCACMRKRRAGRPPFKCMPALTVKTTWE
jgi:hypothetical protein